MIIASSLNHASVPQGSHPYALVGGIVLAIIAMALGVYPVSHPVLRKVLALALWIAAVLLFIWGFIPAHWVPWAIGGVVLVLGAALIRVAWKRPALQAHVPFRFQLPVTLKEGYQRPRRVRSAPGILDFERSMEETTKGVLKAMERISREIEHGGKIATQEAPRMASTAGQPIKNRLRAVNKAGRRIRRHARKLAGLEKQYQAANNRVLTDLRGRIQLASPADRVEFAKSAAHLRTQTIQGRTAVEGYRDAAQSNRDLSMSQGMNQANEELVTTVARIVDDMQEVVDFCDWAVQEAESGS